MPEEDVSSSEESERETKVDDSKDQSVFQNILLDQELLLLILILLVFFSKRDIFSGHLQFLNEQTNNIKNYLEAADATLQALDQASQMPNQILN